MLLRNDFDGGTNQVTLTTGNAGGLGDTNFDTVGTNTGTTPNPPSFDVAHQHRSGLSVVLSTVAAANCQFAWTTQLGTVTTTIYARGYFYFTANPTNNHRILNSANSGTTHFSTQVLTTGAVRLLNAGGGTVATTTATITLNQWVRIEWAVVMGATATMTCYLFNNPDSANPTEVISGANTSGQTQVNALTWGASGGTVANVGPFWIDDVETNDYALPGPIQTYRVPPKPLLMPLQLTVLGPAIITKPAYWDDSPKTTYQDPSPKPLIMPLRFALQRPPLVKVQYADTGGVVNATASPATIAVGVTVPGSVATVAAVPSAVAVAVAVPNATPGIINFLDYVTKPLLMPLRRILGAPRAVPTFETPVPAAGNATATPASITVTVAVPGSVATVAAVPSADAVTVTVPGSVATVAAAPSAVAVTVTVPNDVVTVATAGATIAVTVTVPVPSITATGDATASPATIAVTVTVPNSSAPGGAVAGGAPPIGMIYPPRQAPRRKVLAGGIAVVRVVATGDADSITRRYAAGTVTVRATLVTDPVNAPATWGMATTRVIAHGRAVKHSRDEEELLQLLSVGGFDGP